MGLEDPADHRAGELTLVLGTHLRQTVGCILAALARQHFGDFLAQTAY
jgi:hypothetical protein